MALSALIVKFSDLRKRSRPDACAPAEPQEERKTMTVPQPHTPSNIRKELKSILKMLER